MKIHSYLIIAGILSGVTLSMGMMAQTGQQPVQQQTQQQIGQQSQQQPKKIHLLHANTLNFDRKVDQERQVLRGDVRLRQDSCYMYCDSAYLYRSTNTVLAFSNVRMEQGDSLFLYCDSLKYAGDEMFGELFDNVLMIHRSGGQDTRLYTDYMTYDRELAEAHYPEQGVMIDSLVHIRSLEGWYYPNEKRSLFLIDVQGRVYNENDSVLRAKGMPENSFDPNDRSIKPDYWLYTDTLHYSFETRDARLFGPSRMLNDSATVNTRRGVFNSETKIARLYEHSTMTSKNRFATADSIHYDIKSGMGEAWGDFLAIDTLQCATVMGDYAWYADNDSIMQQGFVTGHALAKEYQSGDTLYLHADTLRAFIQVKNVESDTIRNIAGEVTRIIPAHIDTLRFMQAYYNTRFYRSDMQGVCDSLVYCAKDSLAKFIGNPVMWNAQYQITGDTIFAIVTKGGIQRAMIHPNAFLVQSHDQRLKYDLDTLSQSQINALRADTIHFDQVSGNDLVCYFDSSQVRQMDMSGNVRMIVFPEDSDGTFIGLNQLVGNYLSVWLKNQKMEKMKVWPQPVGSLTPMSMIKPDLLYLDKFRWMQYLQPTDPMDVFRDVRMKAEDVQVEEQLFSEDELNGW